MSFDSDHRRSVALRILSLALLCSLAGCIVTDRYEIVALERNRSADGFSMVTATAINGPGDVVGDGHDASGARRAVVWHNGIVEKLPASLQGPGKMVTAATGLNDAGVIVGRVDRNGTVSAAVWEPRRPIHELEMAGPGTYRSAAAVNNLGWIALTVGYSAMLLRDGVAIPLGALGPGPAGNTAAYPTALNDQGQVITSSTHPDGIRAAIWEDGKLTALAPLPAHAGPGSRTMGSAINGAGQVAGCSSSPKEDDRANPVIWNADGSLLALVLAGSSGVVPFGCAMAINDNGIVVGHMLRDSEGVAFVWRSNSGLRDLNDQVTLIGTGFDRLESATAINNRGEIIGNAIKSGNSDLHPYLLRPLSTGSRLLRMALALIAVGAFAILAMVGFERIRRRW